MSTQSTLDDNLVLDQDSDSEPAFNSSNLLLHLSTAVILLFLILILIRILRKRGQISLISLNVHSLSLFTRRFFAPSRDSSSVLPSTTTSTIGTGNLSSASQSITSNPRPSQSFNRDIERGLTSDSFNISHHNIATDDQRAGLDRDAAIQIENIMRSQGISFDRARLLYSQREMRKQGIDPRTGIPRDPKAVTFGSR